MSVTNLVDQSGNPPSSRSYATTLGVMSRRRGVPVAPLECATCGANNVIQIELTLPDGTEVNFCSCHQCEARWWDRGGEPLELDVVLELARNTDA